MTIERKALRDNFLSFISLPIMKNSNLPIEYQHSLDPA